MNPHTRRLPLVLAVAACFSLLGAGPTFCPGGAIGSVSPRTGDVLVEPNVVIRVVLTTSADPSSLQVTLNGSALSLSGGPQVFETTLAPGAPLLDENVLDVRAKTTGAVTTRVTRQFSYAPPGKARARRITDDAQRITGPLGNSRIGDWLLENDVARFVVQDAPQRDLHNIGQFGGNLIDAELVGREGRDSFFEFQTALNIETVVHATSVEIVNDGQDGTPAIVRACGPDDLLDYVNPSSQVAEFGVEVPNGVDDEDRPVEACTEYKLGLGARRVEVATTVFNLSPQPQGLFIGDFVSGSGTVEQWTPPGLGVGELLVGGGQAQVYFGYGPATGVDYALIPVPVPGVTFFGGVSTSFTTSGVSFVLQSHQLALVLSQGVNAVPTFSVPASGSRSFTRHFAVGDGTPSNAIDQVTQIFGTSTGTLSGCVTVGGAPAEGARVAVGPVSSGVIQRLATLFVTNATGCFSGKLPVGSYGASAALLGAPFEGGAATPPVRPVAITAGNTTVQDFALPAGGRIVVDVRDGSGASVPARVSVVGVDPTPEPLLIASVLSPGDLRTGLFRDVTREPLPYGLVAAAYTDPVGFAELAVEPGSYRVYVSRGAEWSLFETDVVVAAGAAVPVDATLARVLDTTGFVSSDYHVHLVDSPDSRVAATDRVRAYAGEGVDNIVATDHDAVTDLTPVIAQLGLPAFVHSTPGEEITSFDYGHFNAYPQGLDPSRPSRGSTDWAGAAPPGEDFPSLGSYSLTPEQIEAAALAKPQNAGRETVVQINHISSHFSPLRIDTSLEPPQSFLPDSSVFRLDPAVANFFHPFQALELWNGANGGAQRAFLLERIGVWMNLLNQGFPTTAIADTDTHTFLDLDSAGAHSWTPSASDAPAAIDDDEIGRSVAAGRVVGGQGLYVQATLQGTGGPLAGFGLGDITQSSTSDGAATLSVEVQAPLWAQYDTIEIYANAETSVAVSNQGTPVLFGAIPTQVLTLAGGGFTVQTEVVDPGVPGASRRSTQLDVPLAGLTEDTWVVVVVKGSQGTSPPMFPVYPRDVTAAQNPGLAELVVQTAAENGVRALGFTNALYLDVDGNGDFDAPGVRVAP